MTPMTNPTITTTHSTTGNSIYATRADLANDSQTRPPFQLADELDKTISELDAWISSFIGRLVPYCADVDIVATARVDQTVPQPVRSGLESRLVESRVRVQEILDNLDNMNQRLRL